jgi:DNA-directed RNA polymerase subunit RPC12/RpoP
VEAKFKCLRCGNEFTEQYDEEQEPKERSCPKCKSNSIRREKEKK